MTVPASSIKFRDIRDELGLFGAFTLAQAAAVTLNDCATGGDTAAPYVASNWAGYDHNAQPAAPSLSINPSNDASPASDPQQDSHVYLTWPPIECAATYDVEESTAGAGGPFSVISDNQGDEALVVYIGTPATERHYRVLATSIVDGPYSAVVAGSTTPKTPQSLAASDNGDCGALEITVTWGNGTSPGVRASVVKWRQQKSGGSWSAYTSTALSATALVYSAGGGHSDSDSWTFELYYDEEGASPVASKTHAITCQA